MVFCISENISGLVGMALSISISHVYAVDMNMSQKVNRKLLTDSSELIKRLKRSLTKTLFISHAVPTSRILCYAKSINHK